MKLRKKLLATITLISGLGSLYVFASNIIFSPNNGDLLMYCPQQINVEVQNSDTIISTIDMVLTYSGTQIENPNFSIYNVGDYSTPFVNKYDNTFGFDSWIFSASKLLGRFWNQNGTNKNVGAFSFQNKNLERNVNLGFHAIIDTTAGDTNLSYGGTDYLTVPAGVGVGDYSFITGTCSPDTKKPETPNSYKNLAAGAYRVDSGVNINFRIIDQNGAPATYRYPTSDFSLSNYTLAPAHIDNQYGVNSGTIRVTIQGESYSDEFTLGGLHNFSSISNIGITRHQKDKGYDINIDPLQNFRVEEGITITIQGSDNIHNSKPTAYTQTDIFTFNQAKSPEVIRSSLPHRLPARVDLVDPELETIRFRVQDDRAGVDSGSLIVSIRTGTSTTPNGGIIRSYTNNEFIISGVTLNFSSNGLLGSQGITHNSNYDITLTGFGILPENTHIRVMVGGVDMGHVPQHFNPSSFHFQTRQSCNSLQCGAGVNIFTGDEINYTLYLDTNLTITGGINPMISGEYLYCIGPEYVSMDIYTGGTEISYGNMTGGNIFFNNFSGLNLQIEVIGGNAELIGNTLYVTKSGPTCGNFIREVGETCDDGNTLNGDGCSASCQIEYSGGGGGGGGGGSLSKDDCQLPESNLPGANREGIDYSSSYYDRICGEKPEDEEISVIIAPVCELGTDYEDDLLSAYKYACELGLIDDYSFDRHYLESPVTRLELAQMVVEYSNKIIMKTADTTKVCNFNDISGKTDLEQKYIIESCQLNILGIDYKGVPKTSFNPDNFVTEAQFVTAFSRMLRADKYNIAGEDYYQSHADVLLKEYLIDEFTPDNVQTRTSVMAMMQKTDRSLITHVHEYQPFLDTQNLCSVSPYGEELEEAYIYSCERGITTKPSIDKANMYGTMYRNDLAKMVSAYAMVVLRRVPDKTRVCEFTDTENQSIELNYYMITACQLGLMGLDYQGNPAEKFRPTERVTRAQFVTVFSRMIWETRYNGNNDCYYCPHATALKQYGIVKNIENPKERMELRGYVMLMMYRAKEIIARALGK